MILDPKFLVGVAVGGVLGLLLAPNAGQLGIDVSTLQSAIMARVNIQNAVTDKGKWPTNEEAKLALFVLSKWDVKKFGDQSTIMVNRCISLRGNTIVCDLTAKLSWLEKPARIEGVFQGNPDNWTLVSAKTM